MTSPGSRAPGSETRWGGLPRRRRFRKGTSLGRLGPPLGPFPFRVSVRIPVAVAAIALVLVLAWPAEGSAMSWWELLGLEPAAGVQAGGAQPGGLPGAGDRAAKPQEGARGEDGWMGFANWEFVLEILVALGLATLLSALIAYHPRIYGKAATLEEVDQPKIFIMYAVVGVIVAEIVTANTSMALVVFGIGGLLRFRTDVGAARDTGRVILVTVIGLTCGLKIYVVGILGTAFAWILIWFLESRVTYRILVKGLDPTVLAQSGEAHEEVLLENGLQIMSKKVNFIKGQVSFVFRAPGKLDREELEQVFKDIPPKLQGPVDWESN